MFKINSLFKVWLILFLLPVSLIGQKGDITGVVLDSKIKETLIGANVVIQGTTIGASTDLDGSFKLSVSPGTYNIEVSFISYKVKIIEKVNVTNGQVTDIGKIELEEESTTLGEVTVQERKKTDTQMALISSIKTNNVAVTGITFDQIAKSQDKNAAEAIRRVPGVTIINDRFIIVRGLQDRYSTVWLNNTTAPSSESDKRAFSFDAIPSSAIDRMMVYKTPAPELPADFAGAAIQLYTRNLPEKNSISVRYKAGFRSGTSFQNFMTYDGGNYDWLGFDDGTRVLPDDFPTTAGLDQLHDFSDNGLNTPSVISGKKKEIERLSEEFNKTWSGKQTTAPIDHSFDLDYTGKFKVGTNSLGNITSLIYRNGFEYDDVKKYEWHDFDVLNSQINTYDYRPYYDYVDKEYYNNVSLGLMHNWSFQLKKGTLFEFRNLFNQIGKKWFVQRNGQNYYFGDQAFLDSHEMGFQSRSVYSGQLAGKHKFGEQITLDAALGYSYANRNEPDVRRVQAYQNTDTTSQYYQQYAVQIDQQASPNYLGRLYLNTEEKIWNVAVNYNQKFMIGSRTPSFKAGFYSESKARQFDARNIAFTKATNYSFSKDSIVYLRPVDLMFDDKYIDSTGVWVNENTNPDDTYQAEGDLIAGYVALDFPATNWLSIYAGVRMEQNRLHLFDFKTNTGDSTATIDTLNFFPSVNLLIHINEKNKIRLAYGKTINRPEFREFAPFSYYDFFTSTSITGNIGLKNAYIHNVDLRYEYYPSLNEMITIGAFYKKFINPIEQRLVPGAGDDKRSVYYANLVDATSLGGEIEIRVSLNRFGEGGFSKILRNLSIVANAAYLVSEITEVPDTADAFVRDKQRPMQGQSPYIVNTGLFYENADIGLMANIMYNVIGERIITVGDPNRPSIIEKPRNLLDFTVSKKIGKRWEARFGIEDILDQPIELVQDVKINIYKESEGELYETQEVEKIYSSHKPGTKFSFGVSLKF
jgi:outer membrane receptor for ferrienterochelin and colicin